MGMCICTHLGLEVKENGHGKVGVGRGHVRLRRAPEVRRAYVRLVGLQHRRDVPRDAAMNPSSAAIPAAEVAQISGRQRRQRRDQTGDMGAHWPPGRVSPAYLRPSAWTHSRLQTDRSSEMTQHVSGPYMRVGERRKGRTIDCGWLGLVKLVQEPSSLPETGIPLGMLVVEVVVRIVLRHAVEVDPERGVDLRHKMLSGTGNGRLKPGGWRLLTVIRSGCT